jgi:hypothetical protein
MKCCVIPELREHVRGAASMSIAVGMQLGLDGAQLVELALAAELPVCKLLESRQVVAT